MTPEDCPIQCGFVRGSGTTDAVYAIRLLLERQNSTHGLEKAFDRVPWDLIWHSVCSHCALEKYVSWIQLLYANTTSIIQCPAGLSKPFSITIGEHQGSAFSLLLFILTWTQPQ
ncbi:RNA-directed DNA polymerase from mobile element jockey-like protein [Labeo rohita]|uniref:RNA-directed DNA polymerase from mobile element jockey-like protein n=1 Tax=Labeo rohita TaxID=84645 RepID=A0A498LTN5_LABRO|nr:RNA-directed DNA polymerase from mobile element jockey-like protein [Labeo rohita]